MLPASTVKVVKLFSCFDVESSAVILGLEMMEEEGEDEEKKEEEEEEEEKKEDEEQEEQ